VLSCAMVTEFRCVVLDVSHENLAPKKRAAFSFLTAQTQTPFLHLGGLAERHAHYQTQRKIKAAAPNDAMQASSSLSNTP
jgi:hypothetical protein